ncbi:MAG TPA: hypothetical protein VMQ46_02040, partial [Acidimicrobiia bacterium]|nr:hypothetical protein [Acidimicrobiia bacterium]
MANAIQDFIGDNDTLREAWLKTDKDTWAYVGGLSITGEMKERDIGATFATLVADLDETELLD